MAMMNEMEYRTIGSALAGGYRAAVYCRLSKDDDLQGESASIANQRDMLEKYCEKQGWEVVAVYQDDGFTGLNMERPDLQRMLRAIERRQINLVITKDLSRLGRNYLQTGHLIEDFFPRNGVRYIAMNDGIDTLRDNNDIAPFKNILNEMYSKDISKKVHSSYLLKAQKGQFTGCLAPFGYRKDPEDKNHLLIDEETAPIVRLIFGYALNGHGPNYIRRRLEEEKIPCPTWWNRERGLRNTRTKWEKKDPENGRYMWDCALPGFVDSKNEEKTERNAGYLVVSHSGGGMLRQGTRKGIRRTPANRGMRAHRIVKGLDISEDVCHGMCP